MNRSELIDAIKKIEPKEREALSLMLMRVSLDTAFAGYKLGVGLDKVAKVFERLVELGIVKFSSSGMRIIRLISAEDVLYLLKETKNYE